jgi:hypothetical protein
MGMVDKGKIFSLHLTYKSKTRAVLKEKMGKQSNAWPVY